MQINLHMDLNFVLARVGHVFLLVNHFYLDGRRFKEAVSRETGLRLDKGMACIFFFSQLQKHLTKAQKRKRVRKRAPKRVQKHLTKRVRKRAPKAALKRQLPLIICDAGQARELRAMHAEERWRHIME